MVLLDVRSGACQGYGGEAVHSDNPRVNPPWPRGDWEVLGSQTSYPEVKWGDSRLVSGGKVLAGARQEKATEHLQTGFCLCVTKKRATWALL